MTHRKYDFMVKLVIVIPWSIYVVRMLFVMQFTDYSYFAIDLAASFFGIIASVIVIVGWQHARALALLAALVFLTNYSIKVLNWIYLASEISETSWKAFMERLWSFYELGYEMLTIDLSHGHYVKGFAFVFADTVMPLVQIGIIMLFVLRCLGQSRVTSHGRPAQHVDSQ